MLIFICFLIFSKFIWDNVQKSNKRTSVLIIKVENETPGIIKNINEQQTALFLSRPIFFDKS